MLEVQVMTAAPKKRVPAAVAAEAIAAPRPVRKQASGHLTSIDVPQYVMDQLRDYLGKNQELKLKHVFLLGLTKLGIDVNEDDLTPMRKRTF